MKVLGYVLLACITLAAVKAAVAALFVLFLLGVVWGCMFRPAETFGLLGFCLLAGVVQDDPWALVALLGLAIVATRLSGKSDGRFD